MKIGLDKPDHFKLPKMLEGVVKVLNDFNNPMRFSQSANTIRGIADILLNYNKTETKKPTPNLKEEEFNNLKNEFEIILKSSLQKITDDEDREETSLQANKKYEELKNLLSYGIRTRKQQLLELLGSVKDLRILPKALQDSAEKLAEIYNYFTQVLHRQHEYEPEFSKNWLFFQDFLILATSGFFDLAREIDPFLEMRQYLMKDLSKLALLISKPEHFEYFFKKADNPDLFVWLNNEIHPFDYIPEPEPTDDDQYIQFSPWWPGKYLVKVASKIPQKVLGVLEKIKTDNRLALDDCGQAILNMPDDFLINNADDIINLFDKWLDSKYIGFIYKRAIDLFKKYIELGFFEGVYKLLDILSKTKKGKTGGLKFRFDAYHYKELTEKYLPKVIENSPTKVLDVIEKHLKEAIVTENRNKNPKEDSSDAWRPTIEDSDQNWEHDDPEDIFVTIIRDIAEILCKNKIKTINVILNRWLKEDFSIFQRLVIHCARICRDLDMFAHSLILDKTRLFMGKPGYHEYLLLLRDGYKELYDEQKLEFLKWVEEGPPQEDLKQFERYKQGEQLRILLIIEETIKKDTGTEKQFKYYLEFLNRIRKNIPELEHPAFPYYHTVRIGTESSFSKEEIAKMSPEQFINWTKNNLQPPFGIIGPSPEGVSRIFQEVVKENPGPYVLASEKFLDEKIFPTYLCGFINGLGNAIKDSKFFELEPVLRFIEHPLKFNEGPKVKSKPEEFAIGQYSWLRVSISDFIEELVRKNEFILSDKIMVRTQKVLIELILRDEDPTEESERKYGPGNMDYVTYCINSNRGRAMNALIQHALRRARMRTEEEKKAEEGKGSFPPGERMDLYKEFLAERLDEESSPSVQSCYGRSLIYLFYLDQEWVKQMKEQGKLFPKTKEKDKFWEAHWQGYIGFNDLFNQIYDFLKEDYRKAIDKLVDVKDEKKHDDQYDNRLSEHLIIAYWRELEEIGKDGEILNIFFEKASPTLRGHAIWFLSNAIEEVKPLKGSDKWRRLKALWEDRVKKAKDEELADFVRWLKYCPENLDDIVHLIKPIIPFLQIGYQVDNLLEYINEKIETNTKNALYILNELLKIKDSLLNIHFNLDLLNDILAKARKYKDIPEIANGINQAINRLGEMGYYDLRDLLV